MYWARAIHAWGPSPTAGFASLQEKAEEYRPAGDVRTPWPEAAVLRELVWRPVEGAAAAPVVLTPSGAAARTPVEKEAVLLGATGSGAEEKSSRRSPPPAQLVRVLLV